MSPIPNPSASSQWFRQSRFGMLVHWGLYSLLGRGEWALWKEKPDRRSYNALAGRFHPESFDADAWATLARRAGARYLVMTARHHDGFALFDSDASDFTSVRTAARRDFVREYVDACRRAGLGVGLYYSIMSWQFPAAYAGPIADPENWRAAVAQTHEQVRELLTRYGKIDILWYDGCHVPGVGEALPRRKYWRARELEAMARRLQPHMLINDRAAMPGDFATPERHISPRPPRRLWEACMTINRGRGYDKNDREFKSTRELLECLIHCARRGGNLLLNIGPRADGSAQPDAVRRLEAMGEWLSRNGEAIYGSRRCTFSEADHLAGPATTDGQRTYFHLLRSDGSGLRLAGLRGRPLEARCLATGRSLPARCPGPAVVEFADPPKVGPADLPAVIRVNARPGIPVRSLGIAESAEWTDSDAPVLGRDGDIPAPAAAPIVSARELASWQPSRFARVLVPRESLCPGWGDGDVLLISGHRAPFHVKVPVTGRYRVELGLVSEWPGPVSIDWNSPHTKKTAWRLPVGGYPCCCAKEMLLSAGTHAVALSGPEGLGIHALRLEPVWQPLPTELWRAIGPFSAGFSEQPSAGEVFQAMSVAWGPEKDAFDPEAAYMGTDGKEVRWTVIKSRRGEFSDFGVNLAVRCGAFRHGIAYARMVIHSPAEREVDFCLGCERWANAWLNGQRLKTRRDLREAAADGCQFSGRMPIPARMRLKAGENALWVKCRPGAGAHGFAAYINNPGDLSFTAPATGKIVRYERISSSRIRGKGWRRTTRNAARAAVPSLA